MLLSQRKKAQAQHHVRPGTRQTEEELAFSLSLSLAPIRVNNYDKKKNRRETERIANHFFTKKEKEEIERTINRSIYLLSFITNRVSFDCTSSLPLWHRFVIDFNCMSMII